MRKELQVNTVEQGKVLRLLGIDCPAKHSYSWVYDELNMRHVISGHCIEALNLLGKVGIYAFTIAELGLALGSETKNIDTEYLPDGNWVLWYKGNLKKYYPTEAEARAAGLIYVLERNHITPAEVNERLKR